MKHNIEALRGIEKRLGEAPPPGPADTDELGVAVYETLGICSYIPDEGDPTRSLDAAIALCERVLWGRGLLIGKGRTRPDEPLWGVQILASDENEERREMPVLAEAEANTPALALCLAIVRALIAEQSK